MPKPPEPFRSPNTPEARVLAHFAMVEAVIADAKDAAMKAAGEADGRVASLIRQVAEQARRIHDLEAVNEALRARIPVLMDLVDEGDRETAPAWDRYVGGEEPRPGDRVRIPKGVADRIVLAIASDGSVVLKGDRDPRPATSLRLIGRQP